MTAAWLIVGRVDARSPDHIQAMDLRYRVLRVPLGMARGTERMVDEDTCHHFTVKNATDGRGVVACASLRETGGGSGQLLQMAVDDASQGQGHGRTVAGALETHARELGLTEIWMNARVSALGFYERLGYSPEGAEFMKVGVRHLRMGRRLDGTR